MNDANVAGNQVELTAQQRLVLEQMTRRLSMTDDANASLDGKLATLLTAGGLTTGVAGLSLSGSISQVAASTVGVIAVAFGLALYALMLFTVVRAWSPQDRSVPGPLDWDETFRLYVEVDVDAAFRQALSDLFRAEEQARLVNEFKGLAVSRSAWLLRVQLLLVLVAVLLGSGAPAP